MRDGLRHKTQGAFTLIELMLVVVIVAILALAAVVAYNSHTIAAKMTEGMTGAGMIRTALRTYSAGHGGQYLPLSDATGADLSELSFQASDLEGKYFGPESYTVTSSADSYTIRATLRGDTRYWYEITEDGSESKSF